MLLCLINLFSAPPENPVKESDAPEMDNLTPAQHRKSKKNENSPTKPSKKPSAAANKWQLIN